MTKKILIIGLTERMGGVETFIYNTTRFSDKKKYEYDFLVHGTDHAIFQKQISAFYNDEKQHFFFIPSIKKHPILALKKLSAFYKANAFKYDYIHLETGAASEILYVYPFINKYNLKVITHSHNGNGYSPIINFLFRPLVNKYSVKKLSCSNEATNWLFGKKYKKSITFINNGIDTNRFTFSASAREKIRKQYGINNNTLVIGHIGRFAKQKNHEFLLRIFKQISKKNHDSVLMLLGTGELENRIKEQAKKLEIIDKVLFCGVQNNTENYYSAFDVFLMPSLYEGLPIVGIEAQSEGLPCFFSNKISKELGITSLSNFISLDSSPDIWADIIIQNCKVTDRKSYSKEINHKQFSIQATVKQLENVYEV